MSKNNGLDFTHSVFFDLNEILCNFNRLIFCEIGFNFHFSWKKIWYVGEKM